MSGRYIAQPTHTGKWWVLKKRGKHRATVYARDLTEDGAKALAAEMNRLPPDGQT